MTVLPAFFFVSLVRSERPDLLLLLLLPLHPSTCCGGSLFNHYHHQHRHIVSINTTVTTTMIGFLLLRVFPHPGLPLLFPTTTSLSPFAGWRTIAPRIVDGAFLCRYLYHSSSSFSFFFFFLLITTAFLIPLYVVFIRGAG